MRQVSSDLEHRYDRDDHPVRVSRQASGDPLTFPCFRLLPWSFELAPQVLLGFADVASSLRLPICDIG